MAPGGYGKTWHIQHVLQQFTEEKPEQKKLYLPALERIDDLSPFLQTLNLPTDIREDVSQNLLLVAEDVDQCDKSVQSFYADLLQRLLQSVSQGGLRLVFSMARWCFSESLRADAVAAGFLQFRREQLNWSLKDAVHYWQTQGVSWSEDAAVYHEQCQGWPLAMVLYLRQLTGQTTPKQREQWLIQRLQRVGTLEHAADVSTDYLRELWHRAFEHKASYWLNLALKTSNMNEKSAFLQRSAALDAQPGHQLAVLTRLAHQYALIDQWDQVDQTLTLAAQHLDSDQVFATDRAAYFYLHANRSRIQGRYQDAHASLDQLTHAPDFQVRALLLRGLTYYQQGDYVRPRVLYQQALVLALKDQHQALVLDIYSRLHFLNALQEHGPEDHLPSQAEVITQTRNLPLVRQPMIYLNLIFAQLLGEQIDVETAQGLLQQTRRIAQELDWKALLPLTWDVEARLLRFLKVHDRALKKHEQALEHLETGSFAWLYGRLNQALTLLRQPEPEAAYAVLQEVAQLADAQGSRGLAHEARALLPLPRTAQPAVATPLEVPVDLRIQTFGEFQVFLKGEPVSHWPRKKARHLLLYLLINPHQVHRESLADWLTQKDNLDQAIRSLDVHIHALRKVLEPGRKGKQASAYIQYQDACYRFNWHSNYRWDARTFDQGYQYWLSTKDKDPADLEASVAKTLSLYQGPFLPALDFADLWQAEREHYHQQGRTLTLWHAEYWQKQDAWDRASEILLRWLVIDPVCEASFAQLFDIAIARQNVSQLAHWGEQMELAFSEAGLPTPVVLKQQYTSGFQRLSRR